MHRNSSLGAETIIISNAVKRSSGRIFDEARPGLRSAFMCKSVLIGLDPSTIGTHPRNKMDFAPRQSSHLTIVVERGVQGWRAGVLMGFHHGPRSELPIQEFSHRWHPKSGLRRRRRLRLPNSRRQNVKVQRCPRTKPLRGATRCPLQPGSASSSSLMSRRRT